MGVPSFAWLTSMHDVVALLEIQDRPEHAGTGEVAAVTSRLQPDRHAACRDVLQPHIMAPASLKRFSEHHWPARSWPLGTFGGPGLLLGLPQRTRYAITRQALLQGLHEIHHADSKGICPALQLDHVETTHAEFALADKSLMLANALGELNLAHADMGAGSS